MNLRFIKESSCPACGETTVVKEEVETFHGALSQHCNGGLWEKRTFLCGQRIEYIPNFNRSEVSQFSICQRNDQYKVKKEKRKAAKEAVLKFIGTLDADEEYKERLKEGRFYLD